MLRRLVPLAALAVAALLASCQAPAGEIGGGTQPSRSPATSTAPAPTPSPNAAGADVVPFQLDGSADKTSSFQMQGPWQLNWSFDCTSSGQAGAFSVSVTGKTTKESGSGSGMQGHGTLSNSSDDASFNLVIKATCQWHISVSR